MAYSASRAAREAIPFQRKEETAVNFMWTQITEFLKTLLVGGVMSSLTGLFDSINGRVSEISSVVGASPQTWNSTIFATVHQLSQTVITPIAGIILTYVMCAELIQMFIDKNNMHDVDTFLFFKWIFKTTVAILIVTNTWNIVMAVFDVAQHVVNNATGIITSTDIQVDTLFADLEARLMAMEVGPLLGLWLQSMVMGMLSSGLSICIFIIVYGRMIEVYLVTSIAPIPMATIVNREWGQMGQNYLRALLALGFQAFLIILCVAIYAVLVRTIPVSTDIIIGLWTALGYTVLLCFALFKTSSVSKSIFNAH